MKIKTGAAAALIALVCASPLAAQTRHDWRNNGASTWDRDTFWRGAPEGVWERIGFLQARIDRAVANGSLDRVEARNSRYELNNIRRDAARLRRQNGGRIDYADRGRLQNRLDRVAARVHWSRADWSDNHYDNNFATDYDASRYYRAGPNYRERRLTAADEVYRGSDGRYYCKRSDGTTGLIVGGAGGAILGNIIDGGHNRVAGTLIGGALGALAGKAIEQNNDVRCR